MHTHPHNVYSLCAAHAPPYSRVLRTHAHAPCTLTHATHNHPTPRALAQPWARSCCAPSPHTLRMLIPCHAHSPVFCTLTLYSTHAPLPCAHSPRAHSPVHPHALRALTHAVCTPPRPPERSRTPHTLASHPPHIPPPPTAHTCPQATHTHLSPRSIPTRHTLTPHHARFPPPCALPLLPAHTPPRCAHPPHAHTHTHTLLHAARAYPPPTPGTLPTPGALPLLPCPLPHAAPTSPRRAHSPTPLLLPVPTSPRRAPPPSRRPLPRRPCPLTAPHPGRRSPPRRPLPPRQAACDTPAPRPAATLCPVLPPRAPVWTCRDSGSGR